MHAQRPSSPPRLQSQLVPIRFLPYAVNNLSLNKGPTQKENYPVALARVRTDYPEMDQMYQTGRVTMECLRNLFPGWFRD